MPKTDSNDPKMKPVKKESRLSSAATNYLMAYNFIQFIGWTVINVITITYLVEKRTHVGVWDKVHIWLKIFQTASILEVLHSVVRIVSSNPVMTAFQIYSRVFVVWGIVDQVKMAQDSFGVPMLLLTWSITEMIRYSFYFLNLVSAVPKFLTWCRYTFFIALYPSGVTGELLCMFASLSFLKTSGMWSLSLPNKLNFSFNYYYYVIFVILGYIPIFPQLYLHMFKLRGKVLGSKKVE